MYEPDLTIARTILTNLYAITHSATPNSLATMKEAEAVIEKLDDEQVLAKMEALKYAWNSMEWDRVSDSEDFDLVTYQGYRAQKGRHLLFMIWKHIKENAEFIVDHMDNDQVTEQLYDFGYDFDGESWQKPRRVPAWAESKEDQAKAEMLRNARVVIQLKWDETQSKTLTGSEAVGMMSDREVLSWMTRWEYEYNGKVWLPKKI